MEESYDTFKEDFPPQRPSRPIRRPELYATRKLKEEMASVPLQIKAEPKILARESSFSRSTSMPQTTTQPEVPWESVTLNRCLFIAITILVLTSGIQRLHEALHGYKASPDEEEDEYGLIMRRHRALRYRTELHETTLWELMLSWLPDLDDDDDDDEGDEDGDVRVKKRQPKRRLVKTLSGLRNKPLPDKLLKQRDETLKGSKAKKSGHITENFEEASDNADDHAKSAGPKKKHSANKE